VERFENEKEDDVAVMKRLLRNHKRARQYIRPVLLFKQFFAVRRIGYGARGKLYGNGRSVGASEVEGPDLSEVEGPGLSEVEGPGLSEVEGRRQRLPAAQKS